jgi:hypothetical protein
LNVDLNISSIPLHSREIKIDVAKELEFPKFVDNGTDVISRDSNLLTSAKPSVRNDSLWAKTFYTSDFNFTQCVQFSLIKRGALLRQ